VSPAVVPDQAAPQRRPERYWLHALLLALTLITTSAVGARLSYNFNQNRPEIMGDDLVGLLKDFFVTLVHPAALLPGLPFALTLLTILLAHEMGHYLTCMYYGIDASLPYFLPAPTLIGTLGAFIRIRSAIYSKKHLFDVGIAGPLAGFAFVIPALGIGLAYSKVIPGIALRGDIIFGTPWILRVFELAVFPGVPASAIALHPIARAAWAGIFATALNLLPIGQLDGGHILYSFIGDRHRRLSLILIALLIPLGIFVSYTWLPWAVLLFFFGLRHPRIYDGAEMGPGRKKLGLLALIIFILSFTPVPVSSGG